MGEQEAIVAELDEINSAIDELKLHVADLGTEKLPKLVRGRLRIEGKANYIMVVLFLGLKQQKCTMMIFLIQKRK